MNQTSITVADAKTKLAEAHAELDRAAEAEKQQNLKLKQLQKAVTSCETQLVEFESKKSFFKRRRQQLLDQLLTLWPQQQPDLLIAVTPPTQLIAESWGTIRSIDDALADAPRVKRHLDEQLRIAKQRLAEFQQK